MNFKSYLAGILIGLADILFLQCTNNIIGAFLFSFALYFICENGLHLFTGKIGFKRNIVDLILILLNNMLGISTICILFMISNPELRMAANELMQAKLAQPLWVSFVKGIGCGVLIYLAVLNYKKKKVLGIFLAIPAFILAGFEHSIADYGYMVISNLYQFEFNWLCILFGNIFGSLITKYFIDFEEIY